MIINQLRNNGFCIVLLISSAFYSNAQTDTSRIPCDPEISYIQLMKEAGVTSRKISTNNLDCKIIEFYKSDSLFIRQYYSKDIYFEGLMSKGYKTGMWSGCYKGKIIVNIAYLGEPRNRPIYVELWNKRGKHIRKTFLSIIE